MRISFCECLVMIGLATGWPLLPCAPPMRQGPCGVLGAGETLLFVSVLDVPDARARCPNRDWRADR